MTLKEALGRVVGRRDLSREEMASVMGQMLAGEASAAQVGALAAALRMKGETEDEILGAAEAMRACAARISPVAEVVLDTCGTGGDGAHTFNISTAVAFVAAGAGVTVAKHGNRAVSSRCGSADVLAALGVSMERAHAQVTRDIDEHGVGFLFAPSHHSALKHVAQARRDLGFHSVFNLLGPLTNPAGARYQLLGTFDRQRVEQTARVLGRLGSRRAWVVHGHDGLDEISPCAPTEVAELRADGTVHRFTVTPEDAGLATISRDAIAGGDAEENAGKLRALLAGEKNGIRTAVLLNAAAALLVVGLVDTLKAGVKKAEHAIDSGAAERKLVALIEKVAA
ncbi:anthranilate phosphoribosyltransferase [Corallococcus praedator]|uniref:Anthranilate phosphoribosyltransferase n=1 Tax=Corallococcus praedator TaxID=2316724 RepID=A0ABX9QP66_9BACT|nr:MULTISPECIES: anthranilate phosphoribosyltransferase [Corallococcus]RKH09854.1 anthranilate phosphoribosyltransferase [Corallococcus sp. CA047B]RKH32063.1 anthranilate phosphoribosyltransferase [Corallococcus sp. CA031C]RKI13241.1 anthranilate phosphoribosyltransferase [Corallococcus praedator]